MHPPQCAYVYSTTACYIRFASKARCPSPASARCLLQVLHIPAYLRRHFQINPRACLALLPRTCRHQPRSPGKILIVTCVPMGYLREKDRWPRHLFYPHQQAKARNFSEISAMTCGIAFWTSYNTSPSQSRPYGDLRNIDTLSPLAVRCPATFQTFPQACVTKAV